MLRRPVPLRKSASRPTKANEIWRRGELTKEASSSHLSRHLSRRHAMDSIQLSNDEERTMLRDSVRGLLSEHWPQEKAQAYAADPERQKSTWRILSKQGLSALCSKDSGTGLREALIVMAELGRAACPAPVLDAALLNLFIGHESGAAELLSAVHEGNAFVCLSFAGSDPDPSVGSITSAQGR